MSRELGWRGSSGTPRVEIADLAYDSRKAGPGTLFFCVPGEKVDGHEFARGRGRGRGGGAGRRAGAGAGRAAGRGRRRAGGDGAAGGAVLGRPDGGAEGGRGHRDQREDDDGVPDPGDPRGGGDSSAGCWGRSSRWSAGSRRRSSGRRPRRSTCRRPSGGCSTAAIGPARWRSPRTRWRCTAPTRSTSRSALFTNLTQDHLDFHADMEDYFAAKRMLFEAGPRTRDRQRRRPLRPPPGRRSSTAVTFSAEGAEADFTRPRRRASTPRARDFTVVRAGGRDRRVADARCRGTSTSPTRSGPSPRRRRSGSSADAAAAGLARAAPGAGALRAGRRGAGLRGPGRLRAHARLAGERAAGGAAADRGPGDRGLRRRRRPRPRQAAEDGAGRGRALRPGDRHLRQPALRGPEAIVAEIVAGIEDGAAESRSRSTAAPRSPWRSRGPSRATRS